VLTGVLVEDLPTGFSIHEAATISSVWPVSPCYSTLVLFDPLKPIERTETLIPELAERWSWQDNYRNLVFFLRRNVKWHDGQPFTARDVKYTYDMLRESPDATAKLRINPRKDWYANIESIEVADPYTVVFHLKRPQPSLLLMLASGYSPVYPAHVPPAELRQRCVGTGPFKVKEWRRGEFLEYTRNPDYFIKDRPYLDGIKYLIIVERGTRYAAIQAGRADIAFPEGPKGIVEQLKKAVPSLVVTQIGVTVNDNLMLNTTKPPFDNPKVRQAISEGFDRKAYVKAVHEGAAAIGGDMSPPPHGIWGLLPADLARLPGYGPRPEDNKARARRLLQEAGYTAASPLKVEVLTRAVGFYMDLASFVVSELKTIGVEASLRQIETPQWHPMATRREYQMAANLTGVAIDDPDVNFYENYGCGSIRNYSGYCDEQVQKLIDQQSQELDPKKRTALVWDIQRRLAQAASRPTLGWRIQNYVQWPHVKNLVHHNSIFNFGRMQDVWLDR
jgi:peptide/nickel transport system substrate-binding protein